MKNRINFGGKSTLDISKFIAVYNIQLYKSSYIIKKQTAEGSNAPLHGCRWWCVSGKHTTDQDPAEAIKPGAKD